jgi:hypothetical protein
VSDDSQARNRFLIISVVRLGGAILLMLGLVAASGKLWGLPREVGIAMVVIGAFAFAILPRLLARRWRSPDA